MEWRVGEGTKITAGRMGECGPPGPAVGADEHEDDIAFSGRTLDIAERGRSSFLSGRIQYPGAAIFMVNRYCSKRYKEGVEDQVRTALIGMDLIRLSEIHFAASTRFCLRV